MSVNISMPLNVSIPPEKLITSGHGEYILHHSKSNSEITAPSKETYYKAYPALLHFNSPAFDNRYEEIRKKIKSIDSSLEVTFIPRTYYEMFFIKQAIKEDLGRKEYCPNECSTPNPFQPDNVKDCWHLSYFAQEENDNAEGVKVLAYNLNEKLIKKLKKNPLEKSTLSFGTIMKLTEKQLEFFEKFHNSFNLADRKKNGEFKEWIFSESSVLEKFSKPMTDYPMGIRDAKDAKIVDNATTLECHAIAHNAFLLYRGSDYFTDLPYSPENTNNPYSYSFGTGLFAGAFNRGGATAFVYGRSSDHCYVLALPASEVVNSPYVIPKKHPICHLTSNNGVVFHPRTKVWKTDGIVYGFGNYCSVKKIVEPYFSYQSRENLSEEIFSFQKKNVIFLKSSNTDVMSIPPAFQPTIHVFTNTVPGSSLFIRGSNGGLNWNSGKPLIQISDDHWVHRINKKNSSLEYKLLLDDKIWEEGDGNHKMEDNATSSTEAPYFNLNPTYTEKMTRLTVKFDAGLGNSIFIRGSDAGLSWNKGVPLKHLGENMWIWETPKDFISLQYKLLLNDTKWEGGPNHIVERGKKREIYPYF